MHQYINLSRSELIELSLKNEKTWLSENGSLCSITGKHKGRAAKDKFIVKDAQTENTIDWSENAEFAEDDFDRLHGRVLAHLQDKDQYVQYLYAGSEIKLPFKLITTSPRHAAFSTNMFYKSDDDKTQFELLHVPDFKATPEFDKTNSEAFIVMSFSKRVILIAGTGYSGEIKKSLFTAMNFILPQLNVLPMHASVNEDLDCFNKHDKNSCVFFGLSGTGKTTLSADTSRVLIGDDEHGWSSRGVFNFENGCYAKVINLNKEDEPQIWKATNKFGSILENVVPIINGKLNFSSNQFTENTRASYRLSEIDGSSITRKTSHPKNVVMLTYDSFGVLPPVSKLTVDQAREYFLNGFTSKVAGTEEGVNEPVATFSACFGKPFLPLPAVKYADMFIDKVKEHNVNVWLVNTGLAGGGYGEGKRISIKDTRAIIDAILDGTLAQASYNNDNVFNLSIPCLSKDTGEVSADSAPNEFVRRMSILNPRNIWENKENYDKEAYKLLNLFNKNLKKYK